MAAEPAGRQGDGALPGRRDHEPKGQLPAMAAGLRAAVLLRCSDARRPAGRFRGQRLWLRRHVSRPRRRQTVCRALRNIGTRSHSVARCNCHRGLWSIGDATEGHRRQFPDDVPRQCRSAPRLQVPAGGAGAGEPHQRAPARELCDLGVGRGSGQAPPPHLGSRGGATPRRPLSWATLSKA